MVQLWMCQMTLWKFGIFSMYRIFEVFCFWFICISKYKVTNVLYIFRLTRGYSTFKDCAIRRARIVPSRVNSSKNYSLRSICYYIESKTTFKLLRSWLRYGGNSLSEKHAPWDSEVLGLYSYTHTSNVSLERSVI